MAPDTHRMLFQTGEPAWAVNRDGRIVAWNEAAGRALGYPAEAALGRACWTLLEGHDAFGNRYCSAACPLREMAFRRQAVNRCRLSFRAADGARNTFTVTTLVLFETGEPTLIHLCRKALPEQPAARAPGPGTRGGVLTAREREVLELLAEGRNTREMATLLNIGVATVRSHVERIMRKLRVHSRLEAVAVGRKLGLH